MGISLEEKAKQYLTEGRVALYSVDAWYASAVVTGQKQYQVILRGKNDANASCSCPAGAVQTLCSHIKAVRMVTHLGDMPHEKPRLSSYSDFDKLLEGLG
jgi:uncharacterized Zn finger protein